MNQNPLQEVIDNIDEYVGLINRAPQNIRDQLRQAFPLPRAALTILDQIDELGTYELEDFLRDRYNEWVTNRETQEPYQSLLSDRQQRENLIGSIIDQTDSVLAIVEPPPLQPLVVNTFINTRVPEPGLEGENLPP